jgi:hypothetical protein
MQKTSRLAVLSFMLASGAAWFLLTRGDGPSLMPVFLGSVALITGIAALASIRRGKGVSRGRGFAVVAILLGGLVLVAGAGVLVGFVLQQVAFQNMGPRGGDPIREAADLRSANGMPDQAAAAFSSNLGIAVLDTSGQSVSKHRSTTVRAKFFSPEGGRASLAKAPSYDGLATIHLRGYSTLRLPKPSYTLHTVDSATNQIKVPLLGLAADEDWVLYAPFEDKSLIRDVLAYELARRTGHYAPRTRFVELFVRTSNRPLSMRDYVGVYVLIEKIKRGKERVNIAKLTPENRSEPEIRGGYILKRDHSEGRETGFHTPHGGPYFFVYPKADKIIPEQKRWIRQYLASFESALYGEDFANPQAGYAAYLDVDSFIDAYWLVELGKNVDGFRYSSFLTKDRDGKLKPEPPWDWNRSFGNANYYGGAQPRGWYSPHLRPNEISWYHRLRDDPTFARRCALRWTELRRDAFDPHKISGLVDELASQLSEAQARNFRRWPILDRQITCNAYVGHSYDAEVRWLKQWIEQRVTWIDSHVNAPPEPQ